MLEKLLLLEVIRVYCVSEVVLGWKIFFTKELELNFPDYGARIFFS